MASNEEWTALNATITALNAEATAIHENVNIFFQLTMAVCIYFMQLGFCLLEAGSVRSKNTVNIIFKNFIQSLIGGIFYWLLGWGFTHGKPSNPFIGYGEFANPPPEKYSLWFFHFTFACTSSTIVSGAIAERCKFVGFCLYTILITAFVYPVSAHWAWADDGWLRNLGGDNFGYKDFAGSGVVHVCAGSFSLLGALIIQPRIGRFPGRIQGHSTAFASLGALILLFGFFAFNGGSQLTITNKGDGLAVARSMFNVIISGAGAALTALFTTRLRSGKWSLLVTINAFLTGMVAICAGCNAVHNWGALVIGMTSGLIYVGLASLLVIVKIDDPLDAAAVHLGGGFWGVLMRPLFDIKYGVWFNFNRRSGLFLAYNLIGASAIMIWSLIWALLLFGLLKMTKMLRISKQEEEIGLDLSLHGEQAYPPLAYIDEWSVKNEQNITNYGPSEGARSVASVSRSIKQNGTAVL